MPSKWDINQARAVTDIRVEAETLNCSGNVSSSLDKIATDLLWLHTYSTYRGTKDINKMTVIVQKTVSEFQVAVAANKSNVVYCQIKKALIIQQADIIGHTFKGSLP